MFVVERNIETALAEIERLRSLLVDETNQRRNREEYENLFRLVREYPSRSESLAELETLNGELAVLDQDKLALSASLDQRRKQFHVFLQSLVDLQELLREESCATSLSEEPGVAASTTLHAAREMSRSVSVELVSSPASEARLNSAEPGEAMDIS